MIELPGKAKWNVTVAGTTHTGDMAGSVKTEPILLGMLLYSMDIVWTGTPTGTITIYASNSHDRSDAALAADHWNGTWNSINGLLNPAIVQPAGAGGSYNISLAPFRCRDLYVDYARTGGSGSITVTFALVPA